MNVQIADTEENNATVSAIKSLCNAVGKIYWVGNIIHDNLDKCLRALNMESNNSGWYNPVPTRINGATGIYMINENGTVFTDARIIKEGDKEFRIEYLTGEGMNLFDSLFRQFIEGVESK